MKHDVKIKVNLCDREIAEFLDAGYILIGFSVEIVHVQGLENPWLSHYIFSKEIRGDF